MTTLSFRTVGRRAHPHREHRPAAVLLASALDASPEVLLALSLVLVVLGGPVASAAATGSAAVAALAVVTLLAGVALAVVAAARLLRS